MASRGRGARQKGAQFERDMANKLTADTDKKFKRGLGQTRSALEEGGDVQCEEVPEFHFELKRQKRVSIPAAQLQAQEECKTAAPVTITRSDREPTYVTMIYEDWIKLFRTYLLTREDRCASCDCDPTQSTYSDLITTVDAIMKTGNPLLPKEK
jgi:hypothetical protein